MTPLIFYFLAAVHGLGAPYPAPTRPAHLDERQQTQAFIGAITIWAPSVVLGTTVTYSPLSYGDNYFITTTSNYWGYCGSSTSCTPYTNCQSGTLFLPQGSFATCPSSIPYCGTNYLYSTTGAQLELTRPACFSSSGLNDYTFLLVPPTILASPTSSPAPTPIPVGAIVGGVVGGLAVISLAAIFIYLISRRQQPRPAQLAEVWTGTLNAR